MNNKIVFVYVAKGGESMNFNHRQMRLKSVKKILLSTCRVLLIIAVVGWNVLAKDQ